MQRHRERGREGSFSLYPSGGTNKPEIKRERDTNGRRIVHTFTMNQQQQHQQDPQALFFEHVANKDYEALSRLFAFQARNAILSFLAMRHRWNTNNNNGSAPYHPARFEEKMDDFWQELSTRETAAQMATTTTSNFNGNNSNGSMSMSSWLARSSNSKSSSQVLIEQQQQDPSYYTLLRELATFLTEKEQDYNDNNKNMMNPSTNEHGESSSQQQQQHQHPAKRTKLEISSDAERLLRDAAAAFSDSRPPATFVVYEDGSLESSSSTSSSSTSSSSSDNNMNMMMMQMDQAMNHPTAAAAPTFAVTHHHPHASSSQQQQQQHHHQGPPIFDGSVANSTPPPLGGGGAGAANAAAASGGAGTILHLACALDEPLALAFCLAMGADARACHTAFRRLMIHEAACNGSIQCLTLLLELGRKYGSHGSNHENDADAKLPPRLTRTSGGGSNGNGSNGFELPFMPRRLDRADVMAPLHYYARQPISAFVRKSSPPYPEKPMPDAPPSPPSSSSSKCSGTDFVSMLRMFRTLARRVKKGSISEIDAARKVLDLANLSTISKQSLSRTCTFGGAANQQQQQHPAPLLVPRGTVPTGSSSSDGHGNTPLHWAAFKNETECVRLLLAYGADPNARAHPSGWTPLHDAAYSNSMDCVDLLIQAGANVDARANSGATPLCFAAQEDSAEAAALLLARNANLSTRCAGGPIRGGGGGNNNNAQQQHQQPPVHHPHSRFSGYTPLHYCAHYNAHRAARVLLTHHTAIAAMEIPDLNDRLPIHVAVARGSSDVLRELLHAGARVETRIITSSSLDSSLSTSSAASPTSSPSMDASNNSMISSISSSTNNNIIQSERRRRQPPAPEHPTTPRGSGRSSPGGTGGSVTPVSSPILRSMIPSQPVTSSKPWNCLTQRSIDECRNLISQAEMNWSVERHALFTPHDRRGVVEVLKVGKRLEQNGAGIFIELWPTVLSFCGRGWFDPETSSASDDTNENTIMMAAAAAALANEYNAPRYLSSSSSSTTSSSDDGLSLPNF